MIIMITCLVKNFSTQSLVLTALRKMAFENIVGRGENAGTSIFPFSHNIFHPFRG